MANMWRTSAAIACALCVWLLPAAGQESSPTSIKEIIADLEGLGGIDRGLRMDTYLRQHRRLAVDGIDPDLPYVPGKVIVKWRGGREPNLRDLTRDGYAVHAIERPHSANFEVLRIDRDADPEAFARRLAARDDVVYAQAAYRVYPRMTPNDPLYRFQWSFPAIDLERAWDINPGSARK